MIALDTVRVVAPPWPHAATWLNADRPLSLAELRGHVVILDFWTHCCVNCMHVLPDLKAVERRFAGRPVLVVGVHAAKFTAERELAAIRKAIARHEIEHPVLVDADHEVWRQYAVRSWPTLVGIDARGRVAFSEPGETDGEELARVVAILLDEAETQGQLAAEPVRVTRAGPEADARLRFPGKVHVAGDRLFVADTNHHQIRVCTLEAADDGWPRVAAVDVAGSGGVGAADGAFEVASFRHPQGMALLEQRLYVADTENHLVRALDLERRTVETVAGTGERGTRVALGPTPRDTPLRSPWDVARVGDALVVAMAGTHQLWVWGQGGRVFGPLAGTGAEAHLDGPLEEACLAQPSGLHLAGHVLLVADSEISSIRAVDLAERQVLTVMGQGLFDFGDQDGPVDGALLQHPLDVAAIGNVVYVADTYNHKLRAIDLEAQTVSTVLGGADRDPLEEPSGLDVWRDLLVVADTGHHRVVVVDPRGGAWRALAV